METEVEGSGMRWCERRLLCLSKNLHSLAVYLEWLYKKCVDT